MSHGLYITLSVSLAIIKQRRTPQTCPVWLFVHVTTYSAINQWDMAGGTNPTLQINTDPSTSGAQSFWPWHRIWFSASYVVSVNIPLCWFCIRIRCSHNSKMRGSNVTGEIYIHFRNRVNRRLSTQQCRPADCNRDMFSYKFLMIAMIMLNLMLTRWRP